VSPRAAKQAPSASAEAEAAPARSAPRTVGQALLCARPENSTEIARALGSTKASVSSWRLGQKIPERKTLERLERMYAIPAAAWSQAASPSAPSEPTAVSTPSSAPRTRAEEVDELLDAVRAARRNPALLPAERLKAASEERALLSLRARLEQEAAESESRIERLCIQHPRWIALRSALIAALLPYPEASAAVAAVVRAHLTEEP
jgi:transcriptional regulator with XRE-family HTH domain